MANGVYNKGLFLLNSGGITTGTDLRTLLVTSSYTYDNAHNTVSEVVANELTVGGYARYDHSTVTVTEDDTNDFSYLDLDDATFTSVVTGETVGGAILYVYNANDASANLVAFYDLTNTPTNGGNLTVQWAAVGSGAALKLVSA